MPRSIAESITVLENARNDIVDALNSKIEGGVSSPLKVSEIAGYLDQIQTGGGGETLVFDKIEWWNDSYKRWDEFNEEEINTHFKYLYLYPDSSDTGESLRIYPNKNFSCSATIYDLSGSTSHKELKLSQNGDYLSTSETCRNTMILCVQGFKDRKRYYNFFYFQNPGA